MKRNGNIEFGTTPTYPRPPKPGSKASVNNQNEYKTSWKWDMNISLEELINYNETCKIDLDSSHHFETFNKILIYVSHPNEDEDFTIQLGVDEFGIMYEGDYGCMEEYKEIPIGEGLNILMKYKKFIDSKEELERLFTKNKLSKDIINFEFK